MTALVALKQARDAAGAPLPTAQVLSLLRKTPPSSMHPLQKREWFQSRGFLVSGGDGTWNIPQR